jgi:hypothetical protein
MRRRGGRGTNDALEIKMKQLDSKSFWPILAVLVFMAVSYGERTKR